MAAIPINATGWPELMDGNLIGAAFTMFDTAFAGWFVPLLFIVYQTVLILKTQNLTLSWVTGIIFMSLYATSHFVSARVSIPIIFLLLALQLAGILYFLIWK